MKRKILKTISLVLLLCFAAQDILRASPNTKPVIRHTFLEPESVRISEDFGQVRETYKSKNSRLIFLIQDAHANPGAQQNIASVINELSNKYGVKHVFLEGGTQDDSLSFLRPQASHAVRKIVGKKYLMRGELSGAEYLDLVSDLKLSLLGVESKELYLSNLKSYSHVSKAREKTLLYLGEIFEKAELLKRRMYPPFLLALDKASKEFERSNKSFTEYFEILRGQCRQAGVNLLAYPHFLSLAELQDMEKQIDFAKAGEEYHRAYLSLSQADQNELSAKIENPIKASYKSIRKNRELYSLFEKKMLQKTSSVDKNKFKNLLKYFSYLKQFHSIDLEKLDLEIKDILSQVFESSLQDEALRLFQTGKFLEMLKKLSTLQASRLDFDEFLSLERAKSFHSMELTAFINKKLLDFNLDEEILLYESILEDGKKNIKEFYQATQDRDEIMIQKTIQRMERQGLTAGVFIAGGYHSENLQRLMRREGVSYVVISPDVFQETNQARYEEILLSELESQPKSDTAQSSVILGAPKFLAITAAVERKLGGWIKTSIESDLAALSRGSGPALAGTGSSSGGVKSNLSDLTGLAGQGARLAQQEKDSSRWERFIQYVIPAIFWLLTRYFTGVIVLESLKFFDINPGISYQIDFGQIISPVSVLTVGGGAIFLAKKAWNRITGGARLAREGQETRVETSQRRNVTRQNGASLAHHLKMEHMVSDKDSGARLVVGTLPLVEAIYKRAISLFEARQYQEAENLFKLMASFNVELELKLKIWIARGRNFISMGHLSEGISELTKAMDDDSDKQVQLKLLAGAYLLAAYQDQLENASNLKEKRAILMDALTGSKKLTSILDRQHTLHTKYGFLYYFRANFIVQWVRLDPEMETGELKKYLEEAVLRSKKAKSSLSGKESDFNLKNLDNLTESLARLVHLAQSDKSRMTIAALSLECLESEEEWRLFLRRLYEINSDKAWEFKEILFSLLDQTLKKSEAVSDLRIDVLLDEMETRAHFNVNRAWHKIRQQLAPGMPIPEEDIKSIFGGLEGLYESTRGGYLERWTSEFRAYGIDWDLKIEYEKYVSRDFEPDNAPPSPARERDRRKFDRAAEIKYLKNLGILSLKNSINRDPTNVLAWNVYVKRIKNVPDLREAILAVLTKSEFGRIEYDETASGEDFFEALGNQASGQGNIRNILKLVLVRYHWLRYEEQKLKNYSQARIELLGVLLYNPHSRDALAKLVKLDFGQKNFEQAIPYLEKAINGNFLDFENGHAMLGEALIKTKQYKQAEEVLRNALKRFPDFNKTRFLLSKLLTDLGKEKMKGYPDQAIAYFKEAIELLPSIRDARENLIQAYLDTDQADLARDLILASKPYASSNPRLADYLKKMVDFEDIESMFLNAEETSGVEEGSRLAEPYSNMTMNPLDWPELVRGSIEYIRVASNFSSKDYHKRALKEATQAFIRVLVRNKTSAMPEFGHILSTTGGNALAYQQRVNELNLKRNNLDAMTVEQLLEIAQGILDSYATYFEKIWPYEDQQVISEVKEAFGKFNNDSLVKTAIYLGIHFLSVNGVDHKPYISSERRKFLTEELKKKHLVDADLIDGICKLFSHNGGPPGLENLQTNKEILTALLVSKKNISPEAADIIYKQVEQVLNERIASYVLSPQGAFPVLITFERVRAMGFFNPPNATKDTDMLVRKEVMSWANLNIFKSIHTFLISHLEDTPKTIDYNYFGGDFSTAFSIGGPEALYRTQDIMEYGSEEQISAIPEATIQLMKKLYLARKAATGYSRMDLLLTVKYMRLLLEWEIESLGVDPSKIESKKIDAHTYQISFPYVFSDPSKTGEVVIQYRQVDVLEQNFTYEPQLGSIAIKKADLNERQNFSGYAAVVAFSQHSPPSGFVRHNVRGLFPNLMGQVNAVRNRNYANIQDGAVYIKNAARLSEAAEIKARNDLNEMGKRYLNRSFRFTDMSKVTHTGNITISANELINGKAVLSKVRKLYYEGWRYLIEDEWGVIRYARIPENEEADVFIMEKGCLTCPALVVKGMDGSDTILSSIHIPPDNDTQSAYYLATREWIKNQAKRGVHDLRVLFFNPKKELVPEQTRYNAPYTMKNLVYDLTHQDSISFALIPMHGDSRGITNILTNRYGVFRADPEIKSTDIFSWDEILTSNALARLDGARLAGEARKALVTTSQGQNVIRKKQGARLSDFEKALQFMEAIRKGKRSKSGYEVSYKRNLYIVKNNSGVFELRIAGDPSFAVNLSEAGRVDKTPGNKNQNEQYKAFYKEISEWMRKGGARLSEETQTQVATSQGDNVTRSQGHKVTRQGGARLGRNFKETIEVFIGILLHLKEKNITIRVEGDDKTYLIKTEGGDLKIIKNLARREMALYDLRGKIFGKINSVGQRAILSRQFSKTWFQQVVDYYQIIEKFLDEADSGARLPDEPAKESSMVYGLSSQSDIQSIGSRLGVIDRVRRATASVLIPVLLASSVILFSFNSSEVHAAGKVSSYKAQRIENLKTLSGPIIFEGQANEKNASGSTGLVSTVSGLAGEEKLAFRSLLLSLPEGIKDISFPTDIQIPISVYEYQNYEKMGLVFEQMNKIRAMFPKSQTRFIFTGTQNLRPHEKSAIQEQLKAYGGFIYLEETSAMRDRLTLRLVNIHEPGVASVDGTIQVSVEPESQGAILGMRSLLAAKALSLLVPKNGVFDPAQFKPENVSNEVVQIVNSAGISERVDKTILAQTLTGANWPLMVRHRILPVLQKLINEHQVIANLKKQIQIWA